ncbi:hypothetical protein PHISP_03627 [Aspergillus sp. HF37]|nr:hypothetical protein PHISP_03627 [Aspergillus sp. HF37]
MPVTLTVANHDAQEWHSPRVPTTEQLLRGSCPEEYLQTRRVIQSSFDQQTLRDNHISASKHGFVRAVYHAYSQHHHLTLRPEDVWFSILSQLSFFINAHAEEVRSFFVAHEGKKELTVYGSGTIETADFGELAMNMTREIEKNVVDPELRTWIMPAFSATTPSDRVVAAVLMMGGLQKYFEYTMVLRCGIPSVTLLGQRDDWSTMLAKLDRIPQLGAEPATFAQLLRPVLERFVASFDSPALPEVKDFWARCAHRYSGRSGPDYLSGWITAFCFWDADGRSLHHRGQRGCELDGVEFHLVDTKDIPSGFASVPVNVNNNGVMYDTKMVAGMVGIQATPNGQVGGPAVQSERPCLDSIQPVSGWWMYELMGGPKTDSEKRPVKCEEGAKCKDDAKWHRIMETPWRVEDSKA